MSEEKKVKKQLVIDQIESGVTDVNEIFKNIADAHQMVVDLSHIRRTKREYDLAKRVEAGHHIQRPTRPFATSGITGNPVANDYLKKIESSGGGFLKTCV